MTNDNKHYSRASELKKQITDPWSALKFLGLDALPQKGGKPKHRCPWCGGLASLFVHARAKVLVDYCSDCAKEAEARGEQYRGNDLIGLIRQIKKCSFGDALALAEQMIGGASIPPKQIEGGDGQNQDDALSVLALDPRATEREWRYLLSLGANPEFFRASNIVSVLDAGKRQPMWARAGDGTGDGTGTWAEMGYSLVVDVLSLAGEPNGVIALAPEGRVARPLGNQDEWVISNGIDASAGGTLYVALSLPDALAAADLPVAVRGWDLIRYVDVPDMLGRDNGHIARRARVASIMVASIKRLAAGARVVLLTRIPPTQQKYDYNAKTRELLSRLSDDGVTVSEMRLDKAIQDLARRPLALPYDPGPDPEDRDEQLEEDDDGVDEGMPSQYVVDPNDPLLIEAASWRTKTAAASPPATAPAAAVQVPVPVPPAVAVDRELAQIWDRLDETRRRALIAHARELAADPKPAAKSDPKRSAAAYLLDVLAAGAVPGADVCARGRKLGFSTAELKLAKVQLGIQVANGSPWLWSLPPSLTPSPTRPSAISA